MEEEPKKKPKKNRAEKMAMWAGIITCSVLLGGVIWVCLTVARYILGIVLGVWLLLNGVY